MEGDVEPKWTIRPWRLDGFCMTTVLKKVRDKSDPEAKHLCGDFDEIARFKKLEDARLGSVAPELYDALRNLRDAFMAHTHWNGDPPAEIVEADRVMSKARGEQ